ncbi:C40 family peptidase [Paenibacillus sepulcri]|uniref:C40 family peptidase n=1 Tax=Paenibacillus sepulcri TaxID=359917 RepID=A0ABS7C1J3_9BACL|nr:C40 family peptidase [Paenibacillus sepulcri]
MIKAILFRKLAVVGISAVIGISSLAAGHVPKAEAATASTGSKVIKLGDNYLGVKYKLGAASGISTAFDCSSFTQYVFKKVGITLPRTSSAQSKKGTYVARKNLKVGDLVFFSTPSSGKKVGHAAIYAGNNKVLHTYGTGGVKFTSLSNSYWNSHYVTARRVL